MSNNDADLDLLEFEDDSPEEFWSYTQMRDWTMLLGISHAAFRLYSILRSMLSDGKRRRTNRTRRMTHDELCWLASTANEGKPVSTSAMKGWLKELEKADLVLPDGDRVVTSTGRGGIKNHARRYRIKSLPAKGFDGWRNAWDKLDAYREDWRTNPPVAPGQIDGQDSDPRTDPTPGDEAPGQIEGQNSDGYRQNSDGYRQDSGGRSQNSDATKPVTCDDAPSNKDDQEDSLSGAGEAPRTEGTREMDAPRQGASVPSPRTEQPSEGNGDVAAAAMTVVNAYIQAAQQAGCPTTSKVLKGLHEEAVELLSARSDQPFVEHLARLAADLPGRGWWKLTPHLLKNPMPQAGGQGSGMSRAEQINACRDCDEYGQIEKPNGAVVICRHRNLHATSAA